MEPQKKELEQKELEQRKERSVIIHSSKKQNINDIRYFKSYCA